MTFNYRVGMFRIWLVASVLWAIFVLALGRQDLARTGPLALGPPLVVGVVLLMVTWAVRGFGVHNVGIGTAARKDDSVIEFVRHQGSKRIAPCYSIDNW